MNEKLIIKATADLDQIRDEAVTKRILELKVTAPSLSSGEDRPQINLALVIDHSSSMHGEKLTYAKQAAHHVVDLLEEDDRLSLVGYDQNVTVLAESLKINQENNKDLHRKINTMRSTGTTNLSGGWLEGCRQVAGHLQENAVNRTLLLSDGMANVGIVDNNELGQHANALFERGISTSTFGVGYHYNEHIMENIANQGGGNYYFIEHPVQINDIFVEEFKDIAAISAHKVSITLDLPEDVTASVPGGLITNQTGQKLTIEIGDMPGDKTRTCYVCLIFPPVKKQEKCGLPVSVKYSDADGNSDTITDTLTFEVISIHEFNEQKKDRELVSRYANVVMSDQTLEAMKEERIGRRAAAHQMMQNHLHQFQDSLKQEDVDMYQEFSDQMLQGLTIEERKRRSYDHHRMRRMRDVDRDDFR